MHACAYKCIWSYQLPLGIEYLVKEKCFLSSPFVSAVQTCHLHHEWKWPEDPFTSHSYVEKCLPTILFPKKNRGGTTWCGSNDKSL